MFNKKMMKEERQVILCFLLLPLLLLLIFGILPILSLVQYSFTSWNGLTPVKDYVGLDNYIKILSEPSYLKVFFNSLVYFIAGFIQIIIGLTLAIILSFKVKFKSFFKTIFVFPILISGVAISMMFRMFFEPGGTFDVILTVIGLEDHIQYWLGNPKYVNYTLGSISIWRHTGRSFVLYFGAIQAIPVEYYKAVEIEGANIWHKIRLVILPNIKTVMNINFILLTIGAISAFEIPMIMTNGSNGTATFLLKTMQTAFDKKMVGLASSMGVLMTLIIIAISMLQRKLCREETDNA